MAENVDREKFSLDLGIMDTDTLDSQETANQYLDSDDDDGLTPIIPKKKPSSTTTSQSTNTTKKVETATDDFDADDDFDPLEEMEGENQDDDNDDQTKSGDDDQNQDDNQTDDDDKDTDEDDNQFAIMSRNLVQLGVFTQTEEDEELPSTPEEFAQRFQLESQTKATNWLRNFLSSKHGDEGLNVFNAIFVNGTDPREYFSTYNEIEDLADIDLAVEDNQKKVYREFYKRVGLKPEAIEKKLQKAIDYSDLEEESKELHEQILNQDKVKLEELEKKAEAEAQRKAAFEEDYKNKITIILQEKFKGPDFEGIPLTPELKNKVFDFLVNKKYKDAQGKLLTEYDKYMLTLDKPENLETKFKLSLLALSNFDLTKITKKAISKESNALFKEFSTKKVKNQGIKTKDSDKKTSTWKL